MQDAITQWFSWINDLFLFIGLIDWAGDPGRWVFGVVGFLIILISYDGPRKRIQKFIPIGTHSSPLRIEWKWERNPFFVVHKNSLATIQKCRVRVRNASKNRAVEDVEVRIVRCLYGGNTIQKDVDLSGKKIDYQPPKNLQTSTPVKQTVLAFLHEGEREFFDLVSYYISKHEYDGYYRVTLKIERGTPGHSNILFSDKISHGDVPAPMDKYAITTEVVGIDVASSKKTFYVWVEKNHLCVQPTTTVLPYWVPIWIARTYYSMKMRLQPDIEIST